MNIIGKVGIKLLAMSTDIEGVLLIQPNVYSDKRGTYVQLYDSDEYKDILPDVKFVQNDYSYSTKDVLRGIHGDYETAKLISIVYGGIYDVVVDNRPESKTYLKWQAFVLSRENSQQLFVPPGCGNSMLALSDEVVFHYNQTTHYTYGKQFTIRWNDERLKIQWPIENPILSDRDIKGEY